MALGPDDPLPPRLAAVQWNNTELVKDVLQKLVRLVNEELASTANRSEEQLANTNQELTKVNGRLGRLYEALETGKLTLDDLSPRIQQLRQQQRQIQASQAENGPLASAGVTKKVDLEEVLEYVKDMRTLLDMGTTGEQRALLRSFVQEIAVNQKEAVIKYSLPLAVGSPDEIKGPAIVTDGTPGRTRTAASGFGGQRSIR